MFQVQPILDVERLVKPELFFLGGHHRLDALLERPTLRGLTNEAIPHGVPRRQPGQDEVDRRRRPENDEKLQQSPHDIPGIHPRSLLLRIPMTAATASLARRQSPHAPVPYWAGLSVLTKSAVAPRCHEAGVV